MRVVRLADEEHAATVAMLDGYEPHACTSSEHWNGHGDESGCMGWGPKATEALNRAAAAIGRATREPDPPEAEAAANEPAQCDSYGPSRGLAGPVRCFLDWRHVRTAVPHQDRGGPIWGIDECSHSESGLLTDRCKARAWGNGRCGPHQSELPEHVRGAYR